MTFDKYYRNGKWYNNGDWIESESTKGGHHGDHKILITDKWLPLDSDTLGIGERHDLNLENVVIYPDRVSYKINPTTLEGARSRKGTEILNAFADAENIPCVVDGRSFWASVDSALRIDGARRSSLEAEKAGTIPAGSPVKITDVDRVAHELAMPEALIVCLAIAARAQEDFQRKQALLVALDNSNTLEQIDALVW